MLPGLMLLVGQTVEARAVAAVGSLSLVHQESYRITNDESYSSRNSSSNHNRNRNHNHSFLNHLSSLTQWTSVSKNRCIFSSSNNNI